MQNWQERLQLAMPGFRDRIVHISHTDKEGGLNLNMEPAVIQDLSQSGFDAAQLLINGFAKGGGLDHPNTWNNHQRIRVRITLAQVQKELEAITRSLQGQEILTTEDIVGNQNPPGYAFDRVGDARQANTLLHALTTLSKKLEKPKRISPPVSPAHGGLTMFPEYERCSTCRSDFRSHHTHTLRIGAAPVKSQKTILGSDHALKNGTDVLELDVRV